MSSAYVRQQVQAFLTAQVPGEKFFDLSAEFREIRDFQRDNNLTPTQGFVGLQFIPGEEQPITVPATNTEGKYREDGGIFVHVVAPPKLGAIPSLLTRAENLRTLLRGMRIGDVVVESMTTVATEEGATLQMEGNYITASFLISYIRDFDL